MRTKCKLIEMGTRRLILYSHVHTSGNSHLAADANPEFSFHTNHLLPLRLMVVAEKNFLIC